MLTSQIGNINVNGYTSRILGISELVDIQKLFSESSEYFIIEQGKPANKDEAESILKTLPPNKSYEDKFVIGFYKETSKLAALVDIVKDYPEEGVWMLGLLLISPSERGNGLGRAINAELINIIESENGRKIRIGVIKHNEVGLKFWKSQKYIKVKESIVKSNSNENAVIIMNYEI